MRLWKVICILTKTHSSFCSHIPLFFIFDTHLACHYCGLCVVLTLHFTWFVLSVDNVCHISELKHNIFNVKCVIYFYLCMCNCSVWNFYHYVPILCNMWFLCPEFCLLQSRLHHYKIWASHSSDYVEYCHLLCDVLWYGMCVPYWMNLLPPASIFDPEDGGSIFFLNVSITSQMEVCYVILIFTSWNVLCGTSIKSMDVLCHDQCIMCCVL